MSTSRAQTAKQRARHALIRSHTGRISDRTYSSPAVLEHRESFQVNRKMIAKTEYARYMERVSRAAEELAAEGFSHPTYFEVETGAGLSLASGKGLRHRRAGDGDGRSGDATNVIPAPLVCVLVSISMDHMGALGDTLGKIARKRPESSSRAAGW